MDALGLFHRYRDDVYRLAVNYTSSPREAEDVSRSVFLKLVAREDLTPGTERDFLMQTAADECRSLLRSGGWKRAVKDIFLSPKTCKPPQGVLRLVPALLRGLYHRGNCPAPENPPEHRSRQTLPRAGTAGTAAEKGCGVNKQVIDVYNEMTMPGDCARRIEEEMNRAIRQKEGENRFMKNEKNGKKQGWGFAVVLVCLVLVLSVGGVFLFLNVSGSKDAPAAPVGTEQLTRPSVSTEAPAASTEADSFALSETGKAFLEKMCYFLPDWSDDASLNDEFWRNFLFSSFTCPDMVDGETAMTICGEQELVTTSWGQAVKVSREDSVVPYVRLALGLEMPSYAPAIQDVSAGQTLFYFEDGYYYIGLSDFGDVGYSFRGRYPDSVNGATVIFDVYSGTPDDTIGTICFTLVPADNENGFTIAAKSSDFGG